VQSQLDPGTFVPECVGQGSRDFPLTSHHSSSFDDDAEGV
jgi:hypothetical protein